jgi:signal transduction histidine kinase
MNKQTRLVNGVLLAVWAMMIVWQVVEHDRVKHAAKTELRNRAKDISKTVGLVLGSQRHLITKERLESALNSLVKPEELNAVAMLNAAGEEVASAGPPIDFEMKGLGSTGEHWGERTVALMNLVDLGTNLTSEAEASRPTIVVPRSFFNSNRSSTNRPPFPPPGGPPPEPPPDQTQVSTNAANALLTASPAGSNSPPPGAMPARPRGGREGRPPRPFGMSEEEWKTTIAKKGVHSFVIVMSTQPMRAATGHDLWLRLIISTLASISVVGLALAWSNLVKSGELEVRLVRAAELNTRLREMSLAAAGLAHETKNPLNIIRGLAQMISKQDDIPPETRKKTQGIVEEADRVTGQVNDFINFSRPRQLKPAPVALSSVVAEVVRALGPDLEEKLIRLEVQSELPVIEADEQQLRQALFNLLINAVQAVDRGGEIQVAGTKRGSAKAFLEIRDNGPGVPPEHRADVFKPYFTTNQKGTGLGLAVVQQIVLAHGWEIECLGNEPRGAVFRISHLRLATGASAV